MTNQPSKKSASLVAIILVLVTAHFLFILASSFAFIYDAKSLLSSFEDAWNIWLCQPLLIALCLMVVKSTSQVCRILVYIDVGLSVLQQASVFLLYAIADKIG
jgi:hypothetical protein